MLLVRPMVDREHADEMHREMGWAIRPPQEKWIVQPPETDEDLENGVWPDLMLNADVAMVGALHNCKKLYRALSTRIRDGKLTFIGNERFFKKKRTWRDYCNLKNWARWARISYRYNHKNVHYFPAAYHAPEDMRFLHAGKGRIWSWAYFPDVSEAPIEKTKSDYLRICWCGRMIPCKHVDYIIRALGMLRDDVRGVCRVTIVGDGESKAEVIALAKELKVDDLITFKPLMKKDEVISLMSENDIYIFPSNHEEGWGVALEEAMDRCCVPIANEAAGVTLKVVKDGVNGFVFDDGDIQRIAGKIAWLHDHPDERKEMGLKSWRTMQEWSPRVGAERVAILLEAIKTGDYSKVPKEGVCSNVG